VFTVTVETQFKARHSITLPGGTSEPEHEHFWGVSVEVSADKLESGGVVMDFAKLKADLTNITSQFSGAFLNDIDYFRENGPTSESVAVYVFHRLEPTLPQSVRLESVSVSEQVGCFAKYSRDK
jgi:6-pyruvoyltetrahydropterin/6-carboxytetrahydropterin synthase